MTHSMPNPSTKQPAKNASPQHPIGITCSDAQFPGALALAERFGLALEIQAFMDPQVLAGDWLGLARQYENALLVLELADQQDWSNDLERVLDLLDPIDHSQTLREPGKRRASFIRQLWEQAVPSSLYTSPSSGPFQR